VIRAQDPKSPSTDSYYFDAETYLLLWETFGSVLSSQGPAFRIDRLYSDYRDTGGVKLPFMVVQQAENSTLSGAILPYTSSSPLRQIASSEPINQASELHQVHHAE
jgi:hypothetical protein